MSIPGFENFDQDKDPEIQNFSKQVKRMLKKSIGGLKSVNLIMRIVANSTWEHRKKQFMKAHKAISEEDLCDIVGDDAFERKEYKWLNNGFLSTHLPSILNPLIYTENKEEAEERWHKNQYKDEKLDTRVLEHRDLWLDKEGKPYMLTTQPYFVSKDMLRDLIAHCDEHGIDFQIDAESFYFPGHTIRILFKKDHVSHYDAVAHEQQRI